MTESSVLGSARVTWKQAALRLGEALSSVGPDGYYRMTPEQWLGWAFVQVGPKAAVRGVDSEPL